MAKRKSKRKQIRIKFKELTQGIMPGRFKSESSSSRGVVVTGKRKFIPGRDPISSYDWTSMFKARPEVFVREKKRHGSLMVAADVSLSMSNKMSIILLFLEIAFDFARAGNLSGAVLFDSEVRKFHLPHGPDAVEGIIEEVLNYSSASSFTDLRPALSFLNTSLLEKSLIFIVSDFNFEKNYFKKLKALGDYHDVVPVVVTGPEDSLSIPKGNYYLLRDMESGELVYAQEIKKDNSHLKLFNRAGLDWFNADSSQTEEKICMKLNEFFEGRRF